MRLQSLIFLLHAVLLLAGGVCLAPPAIAQAAPRVIEAPEHARLQAELKRNDRVSVIVGFKDAAKAPTSRATPGREILPAAEIQQLQERVLKRLSSSAKVHRRYQRIPFAALEVNAQQLAELLADSEVTSIREDALLRPTLASTIPLIGADIAHQNGFSGAGYAVAILDTGVDTTHPFLQRDGISKVIAEACFSRTGSSSGYTISTLCPNQTDFQVGPGAGIHCDTADITDCRHGTHVAGIAAGNGVGSAPGVAKDADIISIQVFSRIQDKPDCTNNCFCGRSGAEAACVAAYSSDIIGALQHVLQLSAGIDIAAANLSLGDDRYRSAFECDNALIGTKNAIDDLRSADIATVIAAGNNGYDDSLNQPGCISSAISVGSIDDSGVVSSFSNSASWLSFLAPGRSLTSSLPGGGFGGLSGTSMATPHVAGAIALLKGSQPQATLETVLAALVSSGVPILHPSNSLTFPRIAIDNQDETIIGAIDSLADATNLPFNLIMDDDYYGTESIDQQISVQDASAYAGRFRYLSAAGHDFVLNPSLTMDGQYLVSAWWVADATHSSAATYRITHEQGVDDIVVDQTTAGGQWNALGVFPFSSGSTAQIEILGNDNAPVAADAVRLERLQSATDPTLSVTLLQPSSNSYSTGEPIEISWDDSAATGNAQIALYHDLDDQNVDGTLIVAGIDEDPDQDGDRYIWDTSNVADGIYYVYAVISNGGESVSSYAPAAVAIDRSATDSDIDDLPDLWELLHYGDLLSDGSGDWDSDGTADAAEFAMQTNPNVPDVRLSLLPGLNMVAFPIALEPTRNSLQLASELGPELVSIRRLDSSTQVTQVTRLVNGEAEGANFPIVANEGLIIEMSSAREALFTGTAVDAPIDLAAGVNLVGFDAVPDAMDAFQLLSRIGDATIISSIRRFNSLSGRHESVSWHAGEQRGDNFPIRRGESYWLYMHRSVSGFNLQ